MQLAKDNKWACIRPAHPGLMWTSLHVTTGQVYALTEDEEVIDIHVKELATLVVVKTKTDKPGDRTFSVEEDRPEIGKNLNQAVFAGLNLQAARSFTPRSTPTLSSMSKIWNPSSGNNLCSALTSRCT